jgi:hypothetical protein
MQPIAESHSFQNSHSPMKVPNLTILRSIALIASSVSSFALAQLGHYPNKTLNKSGVSLI